MQERSCKCSAVKKARMYENSEDLKHNADWAEAQRGTESFFLSFKDVLS